MEFHKLLQELNACDPAKKWVDNKTIEQAWEECERGDWMLWLLSALSCDKRLLTLAKGKCAETVLHLMKDPTSKNAVKAAIAFGNNEITETELKNAAADAYADAYAATAYAYYAAHAAAAAAYATYADADAAATHADDALGYAAYADADTHARDAYNAIRNENRALTADIIRKIITVEEITNLFDKKLKHKN